MVNVRNDFLPLVSGPHGTVGLNWSDVPLLAQGVVVHSTATPEATAANESAFFHGGNRGASAHIFVDWTEAVKLVRLTRVSWHAGPTANHRFIGIELCETADGARFAQSQENLLDVLQMIFSVYEWPVDYVSGILEGRHLYSHDQTSQLWRETDHTDPTAYLASHGSDMNNLAQALRARLGQ